MLIAALTVWTGSLTTWLEPQAHGHAAENVGMHVAESPAADKQIDHSAGGGSRGVGQVGSGFDYDPGIGAAIGRGGVAGFDDGPGERLVLVQMKLQRDIERTFDAVDADFAIALRGMAVAATEKSRRSCKRGDRVANRRTIRAHRDCRRRDLAAACGMRHLRRAPRP